MSMNKDGLIVGAVVAAAVVALAWYLKRQAGNAVSGAIDAGAAVGGYVVDLAAGGVIGIGEAIGVPRTNLTECEKAIAEGRTWDSSFACPAGTFIKSLFSAPEKSSTQALPDYIYQGMP